MKSPDPIYVRMAGRIVSQEGEMSYAQFKKTSIAWLPWLWKNTKKEDRELFTDEHWDIIWRGYCYSLGDRYEQLLTMKSYESNHSILSRLGSS